MFLIASLGFMKDVNFGVDERQYAKARMVMAIISIISFIISILLLAEFKYIKRFRKNISFQMQPKESKSWGTLLAVTRF